MFDKRKTGFTIWRENDLLLSRALKGHVIYNPCTDRGSHARQQDWR